MKKDAYYFPHFSNSRNDSKVIKLRRVLGIEGYGLYFMLLEVLREQTEFKFPISGIEDLSYEWHISKEKIISVISDFDLFQIIDNEFFSPKLILYLQPYIEKSERARLAARKRWDEVNAKAYAKALPEHNKCNASKVKESKVKESKYIYSKFYDEELFLSKKEEGFEAYSNFVEYIYKTNDLGEKLSGVLKLPKQLKYKEFVKLMNISTPKIIKDKLMALHNNTNYQKGRVSVYLTILVWINNDGKSK